MDPVELSSLRDLELLLERETMTPSSKVSSHCETTSTGETPPQMRLILESTKIVIAAEHLHSQAQYYLQH